MKRTTILASLLIPCFVGFCAADCPRNSDACSAGAKKTSPFLDAVAAAEKKAPPPASRPADKPRPAVPASAPAPVSVLSSPAWLLFVGGLVAGLYIYLGSGLKKRRKK